MKKLLLTSALMLATFSAIAALPFTPIISWTPPATYANEEPITGPLTYKLKCTESTGVLTTIYEVSTNSYASNVGDFKAGTHTCVASAIDSVGAESIDSDPLVFIIPIAIPNSPTMLEVR